MSDVVTVDRLQFTLTAIFHYLFPILSTIEMPHFLSFLTSHNWNERLTGLEPHGSRPTVVVGFRFAEASM
jgi:cytochrome bd-type quinol oxidase subunit 1